MSQPQSGNMDCQRNIIYDANQEMTRQLSITTVYKYININMDGTRLCYCLLFSYRQLMTMIDCTQILLIILPTAVTKDIVNVRIILHRRDAS